MISSNYAKFAACAVLGSLVAIGCTITTGSTPDDGFGGAFGTGGASTGGSKAAGGTGGKATGGASSGGAATGGSTAAGGAAMGGSTAAGGAATGGNGTGGAADQVMCNDAGTLMPTTKLVACAADSPADTCQTCVANNCCAEYEKCKGGSPRTACGYGGLTGIGEYKEVLQCIQEMGGTDGGTITACEEANKTPSCAVSDPTTDALIQCIKAKCFTAGFCI